MHPAIEHDAMDPLHTRPQVRDRLVLGPEPILKDVEIGGGHTQFVSYQGELAGFV
jgi:hypothetical protein